MGWRAVFRPQPGGWVRGASGTGGAGPRGEWLTVEVAEDDEVWPVRSRAAPERGGGRSHMRRSGGGFADCGRVGQLVSRAAGVFHGVDRGGSRRRLHATATFDSKPVTVIPGLPLRFAVGSGAAGASLDGARSVGARLLRTTTRRARRSGRFRGAAATRRGGGAPVAQEFDPPVGATALKARQARGHGHYCRERGEELRQGRPEQVHSDTSVMEYRSKSGVSQLEFTRC